jgi:hypothetical protein
MKINRGKVVNYSQCGAFVESFEHGLWYNPRAPHWAVSLLLGNFPRAIVVVYREVRKGDGSVDSEGNEWPSRGGKGRGGKGAISLFSQTLERMAD